jgi:hypothetical protein
MRLLPEAPRQTGATARGAGRMRTTYMRMLEADAECADWRVVAEIVLRINPKREPQRPPSL